MSAATTPARDDAPRLHVAGRDIPVELPRLGDPRLRLAAVLITVQVLGQTVLDFKLSVAQIIVTIGVCAVVETAVTLRREGVLAWPASAMLTGNSVALLLRTTGTQHGDWWSLNGIWWFVLAGVLALLSKYLIRPGGRHVFNPSNVALVWVLLVIGPTEVFPQYLYWGPLEAPVVTAVVVIVAGAVWVLRPLRMLPMTAAFLATLGVVVGLFAASGASFFAIWHSGPVDGWFYWVTIVLSPETMVFVFFMMSDPVTAPRSPSGRLLYGALTALVAAGLLWFQPTEFAVKLAILSSLTATCALAPALDRLGPRLREEGLRGVLGRAPDPVGVLARLRSAAARPALVAVVIIAVAAPVDTARLVTNDQLTLIERGLSAQRNPQ